MEVLSFTYNKLSFLQKRCVFYWSSLNSNFFFKNCFRFIPYVKDEFSIQNCWNYYEVEQKNHKQTTKWKKLDTNWFSMLKDLWLKNKSLSRWQFKCSHQQLLITSMENIPLIFVLVNQVLFFNLPCFASFLFSIQNSSFWELLEIYLDFNWEANWMYLSFS